MKPRRLSCGITKGAALDGAAGATSSVIAKFPAASVVADTSPSGSCAGGVAPVIGTGPATTVAFARGVLCIASADAYVAPAIVAGPYASTGIRTTVPATLAPSGDVGVGPLGANVA